MEIGGRKRHQQYQLLCQCASACVRVCNVKCACGYGGQSSTSGVVLRYYSHCFFRQGLFLGLELTNSARLTGQQVQGSSCPLLSTGVTNICPPRHTHTHWASFTWILETAGQVLTPDLSPLPCASTWGTNDTKPLLKDMEAMKGKQGSKWDWHLNQYSVCWIEQTSPEWVVLIQSSNDLNEKGKMSRKKLCLFVFSWESNWSSDSDSD